MQALRYFLSLFIVTVLFFTCKTQNTDSTDSHQGKPGKYSNHLAKENSPYLLQHANNPVDWYPWGDEALEKAKTENKMLLVSVGYSACHWCHVMEHESFEDSTVAKIMNDNFVCIKVDREERPDIDDVYMTACHLATGNSCGWPLNAFALPNGQPVWAGTYFPRKKWMEILTYFIDLREKEPAKLEEYAAQITQGIQNNESITLNSADQNFESATLKTVGKTFLGNIDFKKGGRNGSPKFPMPNNYDFLLRYHTLFQDAKALEAVTTTLDKMAFGGIYDHLGGGFARYSTDDIWKVPHFEKMLYDNGQLVSLYAKAFQLTKNPLYQQVVSETLEYIKREMTDKSGGFYSSLDADSEGVEGKFYVWTDEEIKAILKDEQDYEVFKDYYSVTKRGNWEEKNILFRQKSTQKVLKNNKINAEELERILAEAKDQLFEARAKRIRPGLDDKILTSWNALMLTGYIDAYKAFGKKEYLETALNNAQFIRKNMMQEDYRLLRNYKDGQTKINAFLDDYALTIQAFTALYEVTFDESWLQEAKGLAEYTITHFFDAQSGMFNYTSNLDPPLIARKKELSDNVIPGSNSAIARSLFTLGTYLYLPDYIDKAKQMMKNMEENVTTSEQPNFYSNWCNLYLDLVKPPYEVAIVGDNYAALQQQMLSHYLPNAILLGGKTEGNLELLTDKLQEGETMIYVCQNKVCKLPVREVDKALKLID